MALTRAAYETTIIGAVGGIMTAAGLDGTTISGANAALSGPLASAIRGLGYTLLNDANPVDADFVPIVGANIDKLRDYTVLQVLYNSLGHLTDVDEQAGQDMQKLSQISEQARDMVTLLEQRLLKPYGPQLGGSSLSQMCSGKPMPNDPFVPCSRSRPYRWPYR